MKKHEEFIFRYNGYLSLIFCWADFGVLLIALIGMTAQWNIADNLLAIFAIVGCWQCNFTFTFKDARVRNERGRQICRRGDANPPSPGPSP